MNIHPVKVMALVIHLCMYPYFDNHYDKKQDIPDDGLVCTEIWFHQFDSVQGPRIEVTLYFNDHSKYVYWSPWGEELSQDRYQYLWRTCGMRWWWIPDRLGRMEAEGFTDPGWEHDEDLPDYEDCD